MKISGFTIARNVRKYHYPVLESIRSVLPLCDEFIVNVGDSTDDTLALIKSLASPKIKIIERVWNMSQGKTVLSEETNQALAACRGDWALYLQSDEVLHEADLPRLKKIMTAALDEKIDAIRFRWLHFYGSYYRYRVDAGWFQKQDRIVRNNGKMESFEDAFGFRAKNGEPVRRRDSGCFLYHYGWVHSEEVMQERRRNAAAIGFAATLPDGKERQYSYGDLNRFPVYFGSHPGVMKEKISDHSLSRSDWANISRRYWWHPARWLRWRYKTCRRVRSKIV
jgi:glycosyltransferase involved in cell wall biosynthesis